MTTLVPHTFTCPACGKTFESRIVASTDSFGKLHSDLYREADGEQPVCYFVHTCRSCGYSGYEGDFQPQDLGQEFLTSLREVITPEVEGRDIPVNGNFYLAALCAGWRGAPAYVLARIYHMGAWCFRVRGEPDKELFFLSEALFHFEKALKQADTPRENRAIYTYLIGDIYRRMKDPERANEWFAKVEPAIKEFGGDPKFGELARRQMADPSDYL